MSEDRGVLAPSVPTPPGGAGVPSSGHGQIFTALLIALGFLCLMVIGQFYTMMQSLATTPESRWAYQYIMWVQTVFLLAIVVALVVRKFFPSRRRVITMAVSIFLLLHFPFGTAIGIYGLKKVDRPVSPEAQ